MERLSGMTREEAKKKLVSEMEEEAKQDGAILAQRIEQEARENAEKNLKR